LTPSMRREKRKEMSIKLLKILTFNLNNSPFSYTPLQHGYYVMNITSYAIYFLLYFHTYYHVKNGAMTLVYFYSALGEHWFIL